METHEDHALLESHSEPKSRKKTIIISTLVVVLIVFGVVLGIVFITNNNNNDESGLIFTNEIVSCSILAGKSDDCQSMNYSLVNMKQNTCYPADINQDKCQFKVFCDCNDNALRIQHFYNNDCDTNINNNGYITENILNSDGNSCQLIEFGSNNECISDPIIQATQLHVSLNPNTFNECCKCA